MEHRRYLDALLEALGVGEGVTLIMHDWGSALGFDWANRRRDAVKGLAYMEAIVQPLTWAQWPEAARRVFQGFRSESGESMVLENNVFVERVLPGSIQRELTEEEMAEYRRPFAEPGEDRRPTLTWPREIPIEGEPADVAEIVADYAAWLSESSVPKLFVNAETRRHSHGRAARVLPHLAEPDRSHRAWESLHPGGFSGRDRPGNRRVAPHPGLRRYRLFNTGLRFSGKTGGGSPIPHIPPRNQRASKRKITPGL